MSRPPIIPPPADLPRSLQFELEGVQFATRSGLLVRLDPFDTETTVGVVAVGLAAVPILASPTANTDYYVMFSNESTLGQQIALGVATVTLATAGILLNPGDSYEMYFVNTTWYAIASAAAGSLRYRIMGTF